MSLISAGSISLDSAFNSGAFFISYYFPSILPPFRSPTPFFILLLHLFPPYLISSLKGIFQPFESGGVTRLIRSAVKFWKAGNLKKKF